MERGDSLVPSLFKEDTNKAHLVNTKNLKNCRSLKAQDMHPLSKAFKSAIFIEMPKKLKMVITLGFVHFSLCWF